MNVATTLFQSIRTNVLTTQYQKVQNRKARRQAIRSALLSVTNTHSDYKGIGFDEHFMTNAAAELMTPFVNNGQLPTPKLLTTTWAAQFQYTSATANKAIANITPMVTDFVNLLASETAGLPVVNEPTSTPASAYPMGTPEYNLA